MNAGYVQVAFGHGSTEYVGSSKRERKSGFHASRYVKPSSRRLLKSDTRAPSDLNNIGVKKLKQKNPRGTQRLVRT